MMTPNYMQTWGLTRAFGATIREWPLVNNGAWSGLTSTWCCCWSTRTRLVIICNPNNSTGALLGAADPTASRRSPTATAADPVG